MATQLVIEEETGTSLGLYHPHNGYYAGDFSRTPAARTPPGATAQTTAGYYALNGDRRPH